MSYKTHCVNGHPRTPENLNGYRCRLCDNARGQRKRAFARMSKGLPPYDPKPKAAKVCLCTHRARCHDDETSECYHISGGQFDCGCTNYRDVSLCHEVLTSAADSDVTQERA